MNRLYYIYAIVIACISVSCEPITKKIVSNTAQEAFGDIWADMDTCYAFFEEKQCDWDAYYQKYMQKLAHADEESIPRIMEEFIEEFADPQVIVWIGLNAWNYFPSDSIAVVGWTSGFLSNNDVYIWGKSESCYTGTHINTLWRTEDSTLTYMYLVPDHYNQAAQSSFPFWEDKFSDYAQNVSGVIIDLRGASDMHTDALIEFCRYFIPEGKQTLFYTSNQQDNNQHSLSQPAPYIVEGYGTFAKMPLAILFSTHTTGEANIMAYILSSNHPHATTISTHYTGGGGGLRKEQLYEQQGKYAIRVMYPTIHLSNEQYPSFNKPLHPKKSFPYEPLKLTTNYTDPYLVAAIDAIDSINNTNNLINN